MSNPENFLQRWSRRKLAPESPASPGPPAEQEAADDESTLSAPAQDTAAAGDENQPFDPASLPSIDSIDANSDVTAFLRPGVPPDLARAALRKVWTSDPTIRDFVGLVENGWDFNNPDAMSGFGPISAEEVARLASHVIAELPEVPPAEAAQKELAGDATQRPQDVRMEGPQVPPESVEPSSDSKNDAAQKNGTANRAAAHAQLLSHK